VLLAGGLSATQQPPEVDGLNFVKPMLRLWGAPEKDKRLVIFESGHIPADLRDIIREVLDWLDKYLGPVKTVG
jgi:hypothetical protein